jgi:membrane-associated protease RseP (regulator of RpoE activity)
MRFALSAASVLFAGLLSSAAFADEAAAPAPAAPAPAAPAPAAPAPAAPFHATKKMPLRVVRVLVETHQALLFNKPKNTHVLVEQGQEIDGYTVEDIDEDSVTLTPVEGGAQVVLAGPDPSWRRHRAPPSSSEKPPATLPTPEDPYGSAAPLDPYGDDSTAPTATPPAAADPTATPPAAAAPPAPRTAVSLAVPTLDAPTAIPRTDLTAALANFGALASSIRGSFTSDGARLDAISPASLLAKAGLLAGDLITSINGQPLRSLDDAANLYARAGSMKAATIQLQRAGKPVTLRLTFP